MISMQRSLWLFLAFACAAMLGVGAYILDNGLRRVVTNGSLDIFTIGDTRNDVIGRLVGSRSATAIIVDDQTLLVDLLLQEMSDELDTAPNWRLAQSSNLWEFYPDIGHDSYDLHFDGARLTRIIRTRHFW